MSDIRGISNRSVLLNQAQLDKLNQSLEAQQTLQSQAAQVVTVRNEKLPTTGSEIELNVKAPLPPSVALETETISSAYFFGAQLKDIGPAVQDGDALMAHFLKLAILSGTTDKVLQFMAGQAVSNIMQGAIRASQQNWDKAENLRGQANSLHTNADNLEVQAEAAQAQHEAQAKKEGKEPGIDPQAQALYNQSQAIRGQANEFDSEAAEFERGAMAGEGIARTNRPGAMQAKSAARISGDEATRARRFMRAVNGSREEDKHEALKELDEQRNEIAELVLALADGKAEANRAAINAMFS